MRHNARMNLLLLGGTRFLGRAVVDAALARGHQVTLFTRGKQPNHWGPAVTMLVGDRVRTRSTVVERSVRRNREYVVNEVLITDTTGRWLQRSRTHQSFLIEEGRTGLVVDKEREKRVDRKFV